MSADSDLRKKIEAIAASKQNDTTRGYIDLARNFIQPRIELAGWVCRMEGEDGLGCFDRGSLRLIHSIALEDDGEVWAHVSVSRRDKSMPEWSQMRDVWWLLYDQIPGVIVIAPKTEHVNKAEVSHVWGCLTKRVLPDFTSGLGTI